MSFKMANKMLSNLMAFWVVRRYLYLKHTLQQTSIPVLLGYIVFSKAGNPIYYVKLDKQDKADIC